MNIFRLSFLFISFVLYLSIAAGQDLPELDEGTNDFEPTEESISFPPQPVPFPSYQTHFIIGQSWRDNQWITHSYSNENFDQFGRIIESINDGIDSGVVTRRERILFSYESKGRIAEKIIQNWVDGEWKHSQRTLYTYDDEAYKVIRRNENWSGGTWRGSVRYRIEYDSLWQMLNYYYERENGREWMLLGRKLATYESDGFQSSYINEKWQWGKLMSRQARFYFRETNNHVLITNFSNWTQGNSDTVYHRSEKKYLANGRRVESVTYRLRESSSTVVARSTQTFARWGSLLESINESFISGSWQPTHRTANCYDNQGRLTESLNQYWDSTRWANSWRSLHQYGETVSGVDDEKRYPQTSQLFGNYPNPFNPTTEIRYEVANSAMVRITIHDVLGREVAILIEEEHQTGNFSAQWDASGFPSGVYYCRLQVGKALSTKPLLLLK